MRVYRGYLSGEDERAGHSGTNLYSGGDSTTFQVPKKAGIAITESALTERAIRGSSDRGSRDLEIGF